MQSGWIFDVKRFAVHDGEGLRTTLFLKGCPLRCPWCQNPEGLRREPLLWYAPSDCLRCGTCVRACPEKALVLGSGPQSGKGRGRCEEPAAQEEVRLHLNREQCTLCGSCVDVCPAAALAVRGRYVTSQEAAEQLLRDMPFFEPDGGVTLSGGECLLQWEFASEILRICKAHGADTAIESCLLAKREVIDVMLEVTDHFMIDLKILDADRHRKVIGMDNTQILENYRYLVHRGADVLVRTPLIPGYTADEENIRAIAKYVHQTDPEAKMELLNYNPLCISKYEALEQDYPVDSSKPLHAARMDAFNRILWEEGIRHIIRE